MKWLSKDMVGLFHRESLARFGGADGVRDHGLLESALARPENIHACEPETDIFRLASAYCAGIGKNHPFIDGNKRTGILSAVAFLGLNHIEVSFDEPQIVAMVIGLAAGEIGEDDLVTWLRASVQ